MDVTIPVKFSIDLSLKDEAGGILISSGQRTKQYRPGFLNPIPTCLPDCDDPHLFIEVKIKRKMGENRLASQTDEVWDTHRFMYRDWD